MLHFGAGSIRSLGGIGINTFHKFKTALYPILILIFICFVLFMERTGVYYIASESEINYLPQSLLEQKAKLSEAPKECLLLTDSTYAYYQIYLKDLEFVFDQIWVGYELVDISKQTIPDLSRYKTVVIAFSSLNNLGSDILKLCDWVDKGGKLMFAASLEPTTSLNGIANKLGITDGGIQYTNYSGIKLLSDFMIGSKGFEYSWEDDYVLSAINVRLSPSAVVHAQTISGNPLMWEFPCGEGRFVVNNCDMVGKSARGYIAATYSLLEDAFAYPVINSSVFFIDDFPSPVPSGNGEYISRDFKRDVDSFYSNIWWPDMVELAKKYNIKYTGMIIETYDDHTNPPFERYQDTNRFSYFGKMLLSLGGELGYHGYNHQPLCFDGFDFKGKVDYNTWRSKDDALIAFNELTDFCRNIYPQNNFSTYVPPSNILSPEGRAMLAQYFPQIKTLAGVFENEDYEYEQEFCVSDDGIVELPRIVSGAYVDNYMFWTALNELNLHYVNTHFWHPDDTLDADRGASNGWSDMLEHFENYLKWLYEVVPNINMCSASEAAMAIQRYDVLGLKRTLDEDTLTLDIENFYDIAYFMVRIKEGRPASVEGGSIQTVSEGLYIVKADSDQVKIQIER